MYHYTTNITLTKVVRSAKHFHRIELMSGESAENVLVLVKTGGKLTI